MNHSSNESLSKLEFKNDFISDFAKNKLVEVVRVTNALLMEPFHRLSSRICT